MRSSQSVAADTTRESGKNPLDTTFGPHSRRAEELRTKAQGGILEIADTALTHLKLSTVSNLGKIAERYPNALRFFPQGSHILLSAAGDSGDYTEAGWTNVYCELKFPSAHGAMKTSGREEIHRSASGQSVETAFENFLQLLENNKLDVD